MTEPTDITPDVDSFADVPATIFGVLFRPAAFFRSMTPVGPITLPLAYVVFIYFLAGMIQMTLGMFGLGPSQDAQTALLRVATAIVIFVPVTFIFAVVFSFVWQMLGSPWSFRTAYRCLAAVMTILPLAVLLDAAPMAGKALEIGWLEAVPLAGKPLGIAWNFYLLIQASIHVHRLPAKRAWLVFGLLGLSAIGYTLFAPAILSKP